jgi:hypothetical protein
MTDPAASAVLFCLLVVVVLTLVVYGIRRAGLPPQAILGLLVAYLVIPGALAGMNLLDRYDVVPPPPLLLLLGLSVLTAAIAFGPLGAHLADRVALGAIVALQAFRIPVELLLHRLYLEGSVPVQMTYSGRNFDIVSGITGLLLGAWLLSGRPVPRGLVLAWNVLGLALLANILVIAVLSTPVPFRRWTEGPTHELPSTFPWIWLPSFLVQVALGSHLLVFRRLRRAMP